VLATVERSLCANKMTSAKQWTIHVFEKHAARGFYPCQSVSWASKLHYKGLRALYLWVAIEAV
jgi:hypothetical protein